MYDIIIIGAGPAGLTAAIYARRAGKSVLVLEKENFGGQITYSPKVENYPGFKQLSGTELADYMTEQMLSGMAHADKDWGIVLLRYFNPIGAHESGRIGEDPRGIPNNLMPYITQVAIGRREFLSVYGNDYDTHDGTGVRDYIHVVDLALGHLAALNYADSHKGAEAVNLGTGNGTSVLQIVKAFEKASGRPVPYKICERRPGDIATCYADATKAKEILGWEAKHDMVDMCRDADRWQTMNPSGYDA